MTMRYDPDLLKEARALLAQDYATPRWATALDKGAVILTDWPMVTLWTDQDGYEGLLMRSEDSSQVYFANSECARLLDDNLTEPCKAFEFDTPCKHRAAVLLHDAYFGLIAAKKARLVTLAQQTQAAEQAARDKKAAFDKALAEIGELFN